jgi:hypothetical protein
MLNGVRLNRGLFAILIVGYQLAFGSILTGNHPRLSPLKIKTTPSTTSSAGSHSTVKAKRALLIGAWDYSRDRSTKLDWWNLHSKTDIEVMHEELKTDYGFPDSNIRCLTKREETTHAAIIDGLKQLIKDTSEGDIVYFQFSGHGQQIPDPGEVDKYGESLIPSDYISREDSSNNIKNKEIRDLVIQIKNKKPANVTLVFDSCYSGNLVRGGRHLVRGSKWQGLPPVAHGMTQFSIPAKPETLAVPLKEKDATGFLYEGEAKSLGYIVISASRYDEVAQETGDDLDTSTGNTDQGTDSEMGLLSYAIAKALAEMKPVASLKSGPGQPPMESLSTYRDLFERVTDLMWQKQQNQTPAIAGDQDKVLLDGAALPAEPFNLVNDDKGELVMNGGTLHGVTEGSVFALYPPQTKHPEQAQPRAIAIVGSVQLAISKLKLSDEYEGRVDISALDRNRAYEREHAYGDSGLLVNLNADGLPAQVSLKLKKLSVIRQFVGPENDWEVRIRPHTAADDKSAAPSVLTASVTTKWIIEREDGSVMASLDDDGKLYVSIRNALEAEARWRAIKNLSNRDEHSPVKAALHLIPVEVEANADGSVTRPGQIGKDLPLEMNSAGQIVLRDGQFVQFEVSNLGSKSAWVTILDLSNSGKIHPIYPLLQAVRLNLAVPCEYKPIPIGATWTRLPWCAVAKISNPSDRIELFKLTATTDPVDLSSLTDVNTAKGAPAIQGRFSPLAELFRAATLGQKSAGNEAVDPTSWYTDTVPFVVGPKH